jgi:alpha-tubulin suppressor-like RCC1 family protein
MVMAVLVATLAVVAEAPGSLGASTSPRAESTADWAQVSSGYYHTCAVKVTGQLWCWGQNTRGQLGTGGTSPSAIPVQVGAATDWRSVSAGSAWTCATKVNGTLWCWGRDDYGQLGNGPGTTGDQPSPLQVGAATDWTAVSAGLGDTTCGRRATKRIYCWGRDNNGQVGNGPPFTDVTSPVQVAGNHADWTAVSAGGYHVCGRRSNARLYCWGDDLDGAVGDGGTGVDRASPVLVAGGFVNWSSVSAGLTHTCARRANGRLYCFGSDINGGLGNGPGSSTSKYAPVEVQGHTTDWRAVFAGGYTTCARKATGRLYCFGHDAYGQAGTGVNDAIDNPAPTLVVGGATDWSTATIGNLHVCGRRANNRLYCWGYGFFGQRGDGQSGSNAGQPTPTEIS